MHHMRKLGIIAILGVMAACAPESRVNDLYG